MISAVLLTRELKETINFFRFLFAGNDSLMSDLKTPKKDPVQEAAKLNKDCDCSDNTAAGAVKPITENGSTPAATKPTPSTQAAIDEKKETLLRIKSHNQDKFYKGFGGVSIGVQQYKNFALDNGGTKLLDGRETLNNEHIRGTVVSSYYYTRLRQSRVYLGYSISAMFSDSVFYSKNPRLLMNPYCSAYDSTVSSVNGGIAGGDQNMFRETEGYYEYDGATYYYSCQEHFGVRV